MNTRRAIVTGAANGLGAAITTALIESGATVSVCDKDERVLLMNGRTGIAHAEVADVSNADHVKHFVDESARVMGGIDTVVSNAGIVRATQVTKDGYERAVLDFDEVIDVNLRGVYLTGRAAIPHLIEHGGNIVNITTDHIHTCGWPEHLDHTDFPECPWHDVRRPALGNKNFDLYDASKWGIKGFTNAWSRALAPHGVRVNSFGMGATVTPMFLSVLGDRPLPPGTMQAHEVAALVVELLDEGPAGRTGDDVQVWAGHGAVLPPVGVEGQLAAIDIASSRRPA